MFRTLNLLSAHLADDVDDGLSGEDVFHEHLRRLGFRGGRNELDALDGLRNFQLLARERRQLLLVLKVGGLGGDAGDDAAGGCAEVARGAVSRQWVVSA